jgi:mannose/cellobiose epimerase-like protein (N-acyl-D-glucosamine 2-epimerase family)
MRPSAPDDLSTWLTDHLVPIWAERAIQPNLPGYVEYFNADGSATSRPDKTTLVTARLTYTFSHAHVLKPSDTTLHAAKHGLSFLLERCRSHDGSFRHSVQPDGTPIDARSDLYDLAFVLFALGWYFHATGERYVLDVADELMSFIERELTHPLGGFMEDTLGSMPRRQNPHMHLLEACHGLAEATSDPRWLKRADELVTLMTTRLYDSETGSLGEFFTNDLSPASGISGLRREPGHQFEWTWLLYHHARLTGDARARATADKMFAFGSRNGLAGSSLPAPIIDAVDRTGDIREPTKLLWPQTEYVKALGARVEFLNDKTALQQMNQHVALIFKLYLNSQTGFWVNQLDP